MTPILEIQSVSKRYRIRHQTAGYFSLRDRIVSAIKMKRVTKEDFWALNDVSFDVYPGESIGIIGRNGAGKSTLLKILSKITPPTKGRVVSRGRVASLLEVGTGFHPELSGRENIYFNGSLLGMRKKEIESKFEEIVDFSGCEKFLDTALKHYSSGMQLRLAFAVAAFLEPEILIIDEVLAVGDVEFQQKCLGKMEDVKNSGRTILFVSHNLSAISDLCSNSVLLNNGSIIDKGKSADIIGAYLNSIQSGKAYQGVIVRHSFQDADAWEVNSYLNIEISWENAAKIDEDTCIDIACYTFDSTKVFAVQSDKVGDFDFSKSNSVVFRVKNPGLPGKTLFFDIGFRNRGTSVYFILNQKCLSITPSPSNLPLYARHDVILVPEIKFEPKP